MTLVDFVHSFLGYPQTDVEWLLFMLVASVMLVLVILSVLDIFMLISSTLTGGRR